MKNYQEFKENFKNIKITEEKIKEFYQRYTDYHFHLWLAQYSADELNNNYDVIIKIWKAMEEDYWKD